MDFKAHLFICTNSPDKPGKCGYKGAEKMRRNLKERCRDAGFGKDVRINSSGCLGQCERGIAAVIYPQVEWHLDLEKSDDDQLFEAVKKIVKSEKSK